MRPIRITLYSLIALLVLILAVAWFLPSQYSIKRSVVIEKPQNEVYEYVANFHYWRRWNPWVEMEPDAEYKIEGSIRQPGATWSWNGEQIGVGTLTLLEVSPFSSIKTSIEFKTQREGIAADEWQFEPAGTSGTKVTWTNSGSLSWPIDRYVGLFIEDYLLGPAFEHGLDNIKQLAENAHNLGPN